MSGARAEQPARHVAGEDGEATRGFTVHVMDVTEAAASEALPSDPAVTGAPAPTGSVTAPDPGGPPGSTGPAVVTSLGAPPPGAGRPERAGPARRRS